MSIVVVATITPKPGQTDAVREVLLTAIPQVHGEPGCELYCLNEDGDGFVMIERWASVEALDVHGTAEALTAAGPRLAGKLAGPPEVRRLTAVPAGDEAKGAL